MNMGIKITKKYQISLFTSLGLFFLKLILITCRVRYINKHYIDDYILGTRKVVVATWHRCAIYFLLKFGPAHPMTLLSASRDGDLLADFARKAGVIPARGSSTRGGKQGSLQMLEYLETGGRIVATVADGPQGPALRAKPGLVRIAQKAGVPLIPITWSGTRVWMFSGAWDKTIIPKPFSTIVISASKPFMIPKDVRGAEFDLYVKKMERTLNVITRKADRIVNHHDPNMDRIIREDGM